MYNNKKNKMTFIYKYIILSLHFLLKSFNYRFMHFIFNYLTILRIAQIFIWCIFITLNVYFIFSNVVWAIPNFETSTPAMTLNLESVITSDLEPESNYNPYWPESGLWSVEPKNTVNGILNDAGQVIYNNREMIMAAAGVLVAVSTSAAIYNGSIIGAVCEMATQNVTVASGAATLVSSRHTICDFCERVAGSVVDHIQVVDHNYSEKRKDTSINENTLDELVNKILPSVREENYNTFYTVLKYLSNDITVEKVHFAVTVLFSFSIVTLYFLLSFLYYRTSLKRFNTLKFVLTWYNIGWAVITTWILGYCFSATCYSLGGSPSSLTLFSVTIIILARLNKDNIITFLKRTINYEKVRSLLVKFYTLLDPYVYNLLTAGFMSGIFLYTVNRWDITFVFFGFAYFVAERNVTLPTLLFQLESVRKASKDIRTYQEAIKVKLGSSSRGYATYANSPKVYPSKNTFNWVWNNFIIGFICLILILLVGAIILKSRDFISLVGNNLMFEQYCIALCALLSVAVSWTRSPFISLIYAVILFINASVVLLVLGFEFLALVNLLVYVGALAVLFLFVIMLLEIPATELRAYARGWSTLALLGVLACSSLTIFLGNYNSVLKTTSEGIAETSYTVITFVPAIESINSLGEALYVHYADILILNSIVLTIALFGALVLAHIQSPSVPKK